MTDPSRGAHVILFFDGVAAVDFAQIAASLAARYPGIGQVAHASDIAVPDAAPGEAASGALAPEGPSGVITIDGQPAFVVDYHAPFTDDDLKLSYHLSEPLWVEARACLARRAGQTSIRFPAPQIDDVRPQTLRRVTAVGATLIAAEIARCAPNFLGAMWAESGVLAPLELLLRFADAAAGDQNPLEFWIGFERQVLEAAGSRPEAWDVRSHGLSYFVDYEARSLLAPLPAEEALNIVMGACQLLLNGAQFKDRETIGDDGESVRSLIRESRDNSGRNVYAIVHPSSFYNPETLELEAPDGGAAQ